MFSPSRARSTADGDTGAWNGSAGFPLTDDDLDCMQHFEGGYTEFLASGIQESEGAKPTSDATINEGHAAAKSCQGRTKNFKVEEDILLVSAWLNVSMDPIQGVDQTQGIMWARIYDYFHENKTFESTRTKDSIISRWSTIQHDVNVFCGCVSRIEARGRSGTRVDDKLAEALALFKAEDKKHKKFQLMHC